MTPQSGLTLRRLRLYYMRQNDAIIPGDIGLEVALNFTARVMQGATVHSKSCSFTNKLGVIKIEAIAIGETYLVHSTQPN